MKKSPLLFALLVLSLGLFASGPEKNFTIMFYNVENLFDTIDQADVDDQEFLPMSEKHWDSDRYYKKIEDIARVISSVGDTYPEIIGLSEIENRGVLVDLINSPALLAANYGIVHQDSPDERGIDVALLYRKDRFRFIDHEMVHIVLPFDSLDKTRDILWVVGEAPDGKELNIFVNHWSSRYGGMKESEPKRLMAAVTLRRKIDLILARKSDPRFIIMGDFNDEPTNRSISGILQASDKRKNLEVGDLYNLFYDKHNLYDAGSYNYRGTWNMLDQIIISYNLIDQKNNYSTSFDGGQILVADFMTFRNKEGIAVPDRTYGGSEYFGGISDHFPVYVVLTSDKGKTIPEE